MHYFLKAAAGKCKTADFNSYEGIHLFAYTHTPFYGFYHPSFNHSRLYNTDFNKYSHWKHTHLGFDLVVSEAEML